MSPLYVTLEFLQAVSACGLTQKQLAARVGCSHSVIHCLVSGRPVPNNAGLNTNVVAICRAIGCDATELTPVPPRRTTRPGRRHESGGGLSDSEIEARYQRAAAEIRARRRSGVNLHDQ